MIGLNKSRAPRCKKITTIWERAASTRVGEDRARRVPAYHHHLKGGTRTRAKARVRKEINGKEKRWRAPKINLHLRGDAKAGC